MRTFFSQAWPWYLAGPIIGLFVPALLIAGNKQFGVSSNLRHVCCAILPQKSGYFHYDWKKAGLWNLLLLAGIVAGAFAITALVGAQNVALSADTQSALARLGIHDFSGLAPRELFSWTALLTVKGFVSIVVGGFLVGFGSAYAGGCTSGHAISGLAALQLPSLIAVLGFFAGGLIATHLILPALF